MTEDSRFQSELPPTPLFHEYRRALLRRLAESPNHSCTVDQAATAIVENSNGFSEAENPRKRAFVRLYHVDLPKLADSGYLDYDWRSKDIRLTVDEAALRRMLGDVAEICSDGATSKEKRP